MKRFLFLVAIAMTLTIGCTTAIDVEKDIEESVSPKVEQNEKDSIADKDNPADTESWKNTPNSDSLINYIHNFFRMTDELPPSDILFINFEDSTNKLYAPIQDGQDINLKIGVEGIDTIIEFKHPGCLIRVESNGRPERMRSNYFVFYDGTTVGYYDGPAEIGPTTEYVFPISWHEVNEYFGEHYAKKYWVFGSAKTDDEYLSTSCTDPYRLHIKVNKNTKGRVLNHLVAVGIDYPRRCNHCPVFFNYTKDKDAHCDFLWQYNMGDNRPYPKHLKAYLYPTQADGLAKYNVFRITQAAK